MCIVQLITDNREAFREYDQNIPWFGTAPSALLQGFSEFPEVAVHVVSCTQRPMISPEKLAANIWFHSLHVPKIGWLRTGYQGCIRAARKKIREIKPTLVHGQGTERDCSISAVFSGFPNVLTIHGNMGLIARINSARAFSFSWLAAKLETWTVPRTDGVVCITNYTQQAVAKSARRTWVVPNAVDNSFFDVEPVPDEMPTVLCVGNVTYRKNQNNFIRALDSLAAVQKFKLIFLGMADKADPYVTEFFQLLSSRPWCSYEGFTTREKLKMYLTKATLLALPSLEDNCPMVVLEAMASQVPVLAPRVGGVPDLIRENETGLFCNPTDENSLRDGVARLLESKTERERLARNAKKDAWERFHPKAIAHRHLEIYREVARTRS